MAGIFLFFVFKISIESPRYFVAKDGKYISPEAAGVETILRGWLLANLTDIEL
jgi:hypothetical protein